MFYQTLGMQGFCRTLLLFASWAWMLVLSDNFMIGIDDLTLWIGIYLQE
jgi:hypothetical protein